MASAKEVVAPASRRRAISACSGSADAAMGSAQVNHAISHSYSASLSERSGKQSIWAGSSSVAPSNRGGVQLLGAQTDFLEQGQPVVGSAGAAGGQSDAAIAAERPEHHAQAGADLVQRDGGFRVMLVAGAAADQPMPRLTDCLFRFEQGNHDASQPSVMSITRSNALRMSGSSVSGSIMDARMARSMRMPAAIRVAQ